MDKQDLLKMQTERGASGSSSDTALKPFQFAEDECRKLIEERSDEYRDKDTVDKKAAIKNIIIDYVMNNAPLIEDFVDTATNTLDTLKLTNKLVEAITDYDILTNAMNDENVFEIRANGKEIKVEIRGHVEDLRDSDGNIVSFTSPEQQEIIMHKLLGDVRLTPKNALVSGSTIEGFRIAAVHSSATSPDPNDPTAPKYHSFVLRKFNKTKMNLGDIVKKNTLSDNMARFLALLPAGGLTFFTVGPTASGKTTTNNAILQAVPATTRTVLLQNPSEIDLRFKNEAGRVYNDVLHLEAREIDNPSTSDPTMQNLMNMTLRLSPTFVCLGEIRSNEEFKEAMKILLAGHPINTTYHSADSEGAISRFLSAYLACSGNEPSHLALRTLTGLVNVIIVQKIMRDGKRRIIQISEVLGVDPNDREKPMLNDIYRFEVDGEPEYDAAGNVTRIKGKHRRVGKISKQLIRRLQLEGVSASRYSFLVDDPNSSDIETYTGKDIEHFGMNLKKD